MPNRSYRLGFFLFQMTPRNQLSIFDVIEKPERPMPSLADVDFDYGLGKVKAEKPVISSHRKPFDFDGMMARLTQMNEDLERQNQEIRGWIDELQADWTEDDKMMVNNPKEYYKNQELKNKTKEPVMVTKLSDEAIECLQNSSVDGVVVRLPNKQLDRKVYTEVKNKLELIGGKWKGGKVGGFVFNEDPTEYLQQIANGESRNLKKEFQFFGTPDALADRLVELAQVKPDDQVLEPSAGQGAIVKALLRVGVKEVSGYELMGINRTFLSKIEGFRLLGNDFLQEVDEMFDVIIANPPFAKNQDIDHIYKMFDCVRIGGRIVSIASTHWRHSSNSKEVKFRKWLQDLNATIIDVPSGAFSESGTDIATTIIIIDRPSQV